MPAQLAGRITCDWLEDSENRRGRRHACNLGRVPIFPHLLYRKVEQHAVAMRLEQLVHQRASSVVFEERLEPLGNVTGLEDLVDFGDAKVALLHEGREEEEKNKGEGESIRQ